MATSKSFAYNTGSPIAGTDQVGDLAISVDPQDYTTSPGGVQWWQGPDQDLGYVIAYSQPDGLHPTPIFGTTASVGFNRATSLTEAAFINVANSVSGQVFISGNAASTWLTDNGYWNNWSSFGSSGFQWMTISSVTGSSASGVGQNSIGITVSQSAGGIGLSIHNVRATGSYIRGTNGTSNGIVPMLRVFNNILVCMRQIHSQRNMEYQLTVFKF